MSKYGNFQFLVLLTHSSQHYTSNNILRLKIELKPLIDIWSFSVPSSDDFFFAEKKLLQNGEPLLNVDHV